MDNAGYTTLTRQSGLLREMQTVANNLANLSTTGFRKEGVIFAEHIKALEDEHDSLSMASANVRVTVQQQGTLTKTNGTFDFAIEGEGFFMIETPDGERFTRAGSFTPNQEGELVTPDGYRLLDGGGSPIFIPPSAISIAVSSDGTLSADGKPQTQIGLYMPADPIDLTRQSGVSFRVDGEVIPAEGSAIVQGFVEDSNVNPVIEITRMIEVQRSYELGQSFMDKEDERIRGVLETLGR